MPLGFVIWSMLLLVPLRGIDCSEPVTGLLYSAYCSASGLLLIVIIPSEFHNQESPANTFALTVVFFFASGIRYTAEAIKQGRKPRKKED